MNPLLIKDCVAPVSKIGGKAHNLMHMKKASIPVPDFFVISTDGFESFLGKKLFELDNLLENTRKKPVTIAKDIEALIDAVSFSKELNTDIISSLEKMRAQQNSSNYFSVRSSATDEDGKNFSFAGQLESFLYLKDNDDIIEAIKNCFKSAYSERVLSYRETNNIPLKGVRPAVIIQEMIFGDVSGVMFTGNPLNNNPEETLINATFGIGEGVVSGELDADMWITDENGKIRKTKLAPKIEQITFDKKSGKGTVKLPVKENLQKNECLKDKQVDELIKQGSEIEKLFHYIPQDIEFCIKDKKLYILQSRPVTTLSHIDKSLPLNIFDNSNIIESFPGSNSPLSYTNAVAVYRNVYNLFMKNLGVSKKRIMHLSNSICTDALVYFKNRIFYNLSAWYKGLKQLPLYNINREMMENMMGVKSSGDAADDYIQPVSLAQKIFIEIPLFIKSIILIIWNFFHLRKIINAFITNFQEKCGPYFEETFENHTNMQILKVQRKLHNEVVNKWDAPILNDFFTSIFYGILKKMLEKLNIENADNIQNDLLIGQGNMESTKPTEEIILISNWIRKDEELTRLFKEKSESSLIKTILESNNDTYRTIRKKIKGYISQYGSRCMNEQKAEMDSLKEDPTFMFTTIKNYLKREPIDLVKLQKEKAAKREHAEKLVRSKFSGVKKMIFTWVLKHARLTIMNREEMRFLRSKIYGLTRTTYNGIGKNFVKDGLIDHFKDIYFLTRDEVESLIEGRAVTITMIKEIIEIRKKEFKDNHETEPPERMYFYGDIYKQNYVAVLSDIEAGLEGTVQEKEGQYIGTSCSPGMVEGIVKVVLEPKDADLDGEILVTKRTDPGWVPLFPSVSGIIIERGSVLSHSAVVAREMGIPTIVGLRNITEKLTDGMKIRLNGSNGIVEVLED